MKRILSLVLVFTCIFSSFTFLAGAEESTETSTEANTETNTETGTEHVHERFSYVAYYTETTHTYYCSTCEENYTENHIPAEEGKCPCGYFDHEHKPEAWAMFGVHSDDSSAAHSYICSECELIGWIEEEHAFDENGVCPSCGMVDTENLDVNPFDALLNVLRVWFSWFPSGFNFLAKFYGKAIEVVNNEMESYIYYYKILAYLIAFGI